MKTNRELLELAAKAAGIPGKYMALESDFAGKSQEGISEHYAYKWWNPLTDNGDCARLESICGINLQWFSVAVVAGSHFAEFFKDHNGDKNAARRRASTRAAAETGART